MDRARKLIHAGEKEIYPYDGSGVTAAILDTGIAMHPDLAGRVIGFKDFVGNSRLPYDDCGHGTHVAGCLCGDGTCSQGRLAGVAKGCRVLSGKVLDEKGDGTISGMIEGIDWVLKNRELYQVKILNISVSMGAAPAEALPTERIPTERIPVEEGNVGNPAAGRAAAGKTGKEALFFRLIAKLEEAWREGLFVVVAAGNAGPAAGSLSRLGEGNSVVTVGCHDGAGSRERPDSCEACSGRGPSGSVLKKPDLVAPGTGIVSCSAFFRRTARGCRDAYVEKSGTSMSTPLVAGAAALCFQKYPRYTNEQVKRRILWAASDLGEPWSKQGWGMLNVARMLGYEDESFFHDSYNGGSVIY